MDEYTSYVWSGLTLPQRKAEWVAQGNALPQGEEFFSVENWVEWGWDHTCTCFISAPCSHCVDCPHWIDGVHHDLSAQPKF